MSVPISGGKVVYREGELDVERGAGRHVDRPPFAPVAKFEKPRASGRSPKYRPIPGNSIYELCHGAAKTKLPLCPATTDAG